MDLESASQIAAKHFGITGNATTLAGERNPNFLITNTTEKFVLKIHSVDEIPQIQLQQKVLL